MGTLIERLTRAGERGGAGMGFGASSRPERTLAVVVRTSSATAADVIAAGVDGVLLSDDGAVDAGRVAIGRSVASADTDFIYLAATDPAERWAVERVDRLLEIDAAADEVMLRALSSLEVEAIVVPLRTPSPTVADLAHLRRILAGSAKPAVVALAGEPAAELLRLVREVGAVGVLVTADGGAAGRLIGLVEALPARPRPRRGGGEGVLGMSRG